MCEIDTHGDWETQVAKERFVTACRKQHHCTCCGANINVGDSCMYFFGVYDRNPGEQRCCIACNETRVLFNQVHKVEVWPEGLWDMLQDCRREGEKEKAMWEPHIEAIRLRNQLARSSP